MERTISFMNGEGPLGHNTRAFIAANVDADRTKDNIIFVNEDLKKVYHKLFDDSLKKYNTKQKRKDRQIKNYYEKISRSKQEKLFYEVIVQIGNRDDTGVGSDAADIAVKVLADYVEQFIRKNPQLYVFGAYIHMDEETPHVHIDFVPFLTDNKRGLETKNSLKGALASRGFESERCYYYSNGIIDKNTAFKTGDILKKGGKFYIVIKRQCDLNRTDNSNLYVLKMSEVKNTSVNPISISEDGGTIHILNNHYSLEETDISIVNEELNDVYSKTRVLHRGKILEMNSQVIIPCVCGKKVVSIELKELLLIEFKDDNIDKYTRIARLLEPYISIVTEKFASYMSSKGSMRTPEELFTGKYFIDDKVE